MSKKNNPPYEREIDTKKLSELYERLHKAEPGKEAREIHKELKKFGDGIPLFYRYPLVSYVPSLVMSIAALIISIISIVRLCGAG